MSLVEPNMERIVTALEKQQHELTLIQITLAKLQTIAERDVSALERTLDSMNDMERRLDKVEQQLARWTAIAGVAGAGGGLGIGKLMEMVGWG